VPTVQPHSSISRSRPVSFQCVHVFCEASKSMSIPSGNYHEVVSLEAVLISLRSTIYSSIVSIRSAAEQCARNVSATQTGDADADSTAADCSQPLPNTKPSYVLLAGSSSSCSSRARIVSLLSLHAPPCDASPRDASPRGANPKAGEKLPSSDPSSCWCIHGPCPGAKL